MATTITRLESTSAAENVYANVLADTYNTGALYVASLTSTSGDMQSALRFVFENAIPRYNVFSEALLNLSVNGTPASNALTIQVHLIKAGNPALPTTVAGISGASRTTAVVERSMTAVGTGYQTFDIAALLNEILQTSAVSSFVVVVRDKVRSYVNNNRMQFRTHGYDSGANRPYFTGTYDAPPARTGSVSRTIPAPTRARTGSFPTTVTGSTIRSIPAPTRSSAAQAGTPPEVTGRNAREIPAPSRVMRGGQGNPKQNTVFGFDRMELDTHFAVTAAGEVYGFQAAYDTVLGGVRDGVIGNADDAWLAESGTRVRVPAPLQFTAALIGRSDVRLDSDVLERELVNIREIHHTDGRVLDVSDVLLRANPKEGVFELSAIPNGSIFRDLLLSGVATAAFKTTDATPEVPVFAIDAAGGFVAPIRAKRVTRGVLSFALKLEERGVLPVASLGRPIEGDGTSDPTSVTVSYQGAYLHVSVRGVETRVRESSLGTFGAVLAGKLYFTAARATLVICSDDGVKREQVPVGAPVDLSERVLTAGVDANGVGLGAFFAPPTRSVGTTFFSFAVPSFERASREVERHYKLLTRPGMTWEVVPPDYALEIARADSKAFELAPGETQTFDFTVKRVGSYTGGIDFTPSATGLTTSYSVLSVTGDATVYRVSVIAPAGTAEGSFPFHIDAKATGADNPGSALSGVRVAFDALLEVAASPVIAPNPTYLLTANDPVQKRPGTILADTSGQGNTFSFFGYARPGRQGRSFLAVGKEGAAVASMALGNTAQAHRMNGEQTHAMILREVSKAAVGKVLFHAGADAASDGPQILWAQGGFTLRTVIGGTVTTSPEVLEWSSGQAELGLRVSASEVVLTRRSDMRSIRMARPAWSDAAVRAVWGAARASGNIFSNLGRVHVVTACGHPYALTDIQLRRTIDALRLNVPTFDGKPEYADGMYIISLFNDNTTEQPQEKRRNYAAPALGPSWKPLGTGVTYPAGAVQTSGADDTVWTTDFIDFASGNDYEVVAVINDLSQSGNYLYHFAVAAAGQYNGYFGVMKNYTGLPMLRTLTNDGEIIQTELSGSSKTGKLVLRFTPTGGGRYIKMTDLASGKAVQIDRGAVVSGQTAFTVGGGYVAGTSGAANPRIRWTAKATGLEVNVHKGLLSAQEVADLKTLLL